MGNFQSKNFMLRFGITAAVASAVLYILLGSKCPDPPSSPGTSDSRKKYHRTGKDILGLCNFGTSCYLNALLQALAACHYYCEYVSKYEELDKLGSKRDMNDPSFRIFSAMSNANQYINRDLVGDDYSMSREIPKSVLSTFRKWNSVPICSTEEQDSYEVFNVIINALVEEQKLIARRSFLYTIRSVQDLRPVSNCNGISAVAKRSHASGDDGKGLLNILSRTPVGTHIVTRASVVELDRCPASTGWSDWNNPFVGRFATSFQCLMCYAKMPIKFEEFNDLTLSLPQNRSLVTLDDLIKNYFKQTIVHDVDCVNCSLKTRKAVKSAFSKRMCIAKLPRSLCFHVNRAVWNNLGSNKRFDFIPFNEILDMSMVDGLIDLLKDEAKNDAANEDMTENSLENELLNTVNFEQTSASGDSEIASHRRSEHSKYKLMSVICHRGGANSGHFVTYRRSPGKIGSYEEWYMVSDTSVFPVLIEQVLLQHAYMIIYDRID